MAYDARVRGALHLIDCQWNAGLKAEACDLLRLFGENTRDEKEEWLVTHDRLAELTKDMQPTGLLEEVKTGIDLHIAALEEGLASLHQAAERYSCQE